MATVQIYRDAPVIANKVRPNGSMPNRFDILNLKYPVQDYLFGGIVDVPDPEVLELTLSSRRGLRLRNTWIRTLWQTAF